MVASSREPAHTSSTPVQNHKSGFVRSLVTYLHEPSAQMPQLNTFRLAEHQLEAAFTSTDLEVIRREL